MIQNRALGPLALTRGAPIVAALSSVPATLYVGVEAEISGSAASGTPDGTTVPVSVNGVLLATSCVYSETWSVTAAPSSEMVGSSIVVSVPGDTATADVVQPTLSADLTTWASEGANPGAGDDTSREVIESSATSVHRLNSSVTDYDPDVALDLSLRVKRGSGTRSFRAYVADGSNGQANFNTSALFGTKAWVRSGGLNAWTTDGEIYLLFESQFEPQAAGTIRLALLSDVLAQNYAGDGTSSLLIGNVEISQDNHATADWFSTTSGNEVVAILAPADGQRPTGATIQISVTAPSQPAVFVDGSFAGWATRSPLNNAIWTYDWTSSSGAHTVHAIAGGVTSDSVAFTVPSAAIEDYIPIVVVLGQSNAERLGAVSGTTTGVGQQLYVRRNNHADETDTTPAQDEEVDVSSLTTTGAGRGNGWASVVGALLGSSTDFGLVQWAVSGSDVVSQWDPDNPAGWWQTYGLPFVQAQIEDIEATSGLPAVIVGVIVHQGEQTAALGNQASWGAAWDSVLASLAAPKARKTYCEIHEVGEPTALLNTYLHAQAAADPLAEYVASQDVSYEFADNIHLTYYSGDHLIGPRIAHALGIVAYPETTLVDPDTSDTGSWTPIGLEPRVGDAVSGVTLTENSATSGHRLNHAIVRDETLPLYVVLRAKRSVGTRDFRITLGSATASLDLSGGGSHSTGGGASQTVQDPDADGCYTTVAVFPAGSDATVLLQMLSGTASTYAGDGASSVFVDNVRAYQ